MSAEKVELAVNRVVTTLNTLAKTLEKHPVEREKVDKIFAYIARKAGAVQSQALANAAVPASSFSFDLELPALPAPALLGPTHMTAPSLVQPVPSYPPGARGGAPTRSGLTVDQLGGRLSRDARDAAHVASSQTVAGAEFIDDDEDVSSPSSNSADEDVGFVDD